MDSKVTHILLAPLLLAVVSSSNMATNLTTQASSSPSSSSEPSSSSSPSSFSTSSASLSPLCPCVPTNPVPTQCPTCPSLTSPPTTPFTWAFLSLTGGDDPCRGVVYLHLGPDHSGPVCHDSDLRGLQLCQEPQCGDVLIQSPRGTTKKGFHILMSGAVSNKTCSTLHIQCQAGSGSRQLAAYKVVTGLLCVLVLIFVLVRFGPHIYTTACKRLFGRRKREWIGPTESVSFRAHNTLYPNSDADKRLSYPGLDRLTVSSSREPSSNRNSDYDSYG
ncbi:hypothetical protein SKAU_G00344960 [Synaphobranchus kaupii]|uniref:SRCR domain-containing protein n=1 Tax=Synaphobranchus kaupii TaxID=118154 RepID=A0A9Q1EJB3_SYNKA|nr:hypothetical protein SKAU_G00344960 [Synaphobranchus kaupii]